MAILPIRTLGDPVLREPTRPVERFDRALAALADDMIQTMYDAPGVGLAAPQIGRSLRFFVFDDQSGMEPMAVANPELHDPEGEATMEEGCLSIPGLYFETVRSNQVVCRGQDLRGKPVEIAGEGFLARILQHETDHLDGTLYIDRLTDEVRGEAMKAIRDIELGLATPPPSRGSRST